MIRWATALALLTVGCAPLPAIVPPMTGPSSMGAPPAAPVAAPAQPAACENGVVPAFGEACAPAVAAADEHEGPDDEVDDLPDAAGPPDPVSSPALALSDKEFEDRFRKDQPSLGSMSIGRASGGVLLNGVQMPKGERWLLIDPGHAWGTRETIDALARCIDRVNERFRDTPPLSIGHISAKAGGHLSPHVSHQSGRDVDAGYYYRPGQSRQFTRATASNLDVPRTWALVRAAMKETRIEFIFIDTSIQRLLVDHAVKSGEDAAFLDDAFQVRNKNARAPIRHARGHANHLHFRFYNPVAEAVGRRAARFVPPPPPPRPRNREAPPSAVANIVYVQHKARSGDTLVTLAKRYGTTVEEIQKVNGLKSIAIRAGATYKIPTKVAAKPTAAPRGGAVARRQPAKPSGAPRGGAAPRR